MPHYLIQYMKCAVIFCLLICFSTARILIDDFSVSSRMVNNTLQLDCTHASGKTILGGERDLIVQIGASDGCYSMVTQDLWMIWAEDLLQDTIIKTEIQYDGVDSSATINPSGLQLNFLALGVTGFFIDISKTGSSFGAFSSTIRVIDNEDKQSYYTFDQFEEVSLLQISLDAFSGTIDLSEVKAIVVETHVQNCVIVVSQFGLISNQDETIVVEEEQVEDESSGATTLQLTTLFTLMLISFL